MESINQFIKQYHAPVLIALVSKLLILSMVGTLIYIFFNPRGVNLDILQLWNVWDAPHYISVASAGYQKLGDEANFIIYLPLFSLTISLLKSIFHTSYLISGYISSFISSVLLAIMLYKLTLIDYSKKYAIMTVLMLFIFPTSFFLHIPYTEALFILLTVSSFYFVRKQHYGLSFICIGLATATKIVGLALIPAIFAEILIFDKQNFNNKDTYNKLGILIFGLLVSLCGFLIYLLINYYLWGNFFYFTIIQKQHWYESFSPFGQGLIAAYKSLFWRSGLDKIMLGYGQILAFIFGLVMSVYVLLRVRISYGLFMLINLGFFYSMSFWICMMRYILTLFPMYIVLARFSDNKVFRYSWISISIILLIIFSLIFTQYGPVL